MANGDLTKIVIIDNVKYLPSRKQYVPDVNYYNNWLAEQNLEVHFVSKEEFDHIKLMCSDRFYVNQYGVKLMWPEDFLKKQHLLVTDHTNVLDSVLAMAEDMKSIIASRRDLVPLQHGVNFEDNKVIEDFYLTMKDHIFSIETMNVLNRNRVLSYKERLNLRVIENIGVGY